MKVEEFIMKLTDGEGITDGAGQREASNGASNPPNSSSSLQEVMINSIVVPNSNQNGRQQQQQPQVERNLPPQSYCNATANRPKQSGKSQARPLNSAFVQQHPGVQAQRFASLQHQSRTYFPSGSQQNFLNYPNPNVQSPYPELLNHAPMPMNYFPTDPNAYMPYNVAYGGYGPHAMWPGVIPFEAGMPNFPMMPVEEQKHIPVTTYYNTESYQGRKKPAQPYQAQTSNVNNVNMAKQSQSKANQPSRKTNNVQNNAKQAQNNPRNANLQVQQKCLQQIFNDISLGENEKPKPPPIRVETRNKPQPSTSRPKEVKPPQTNSRNTTTASLYSPNITIPNFRPRIVKVGEDVGEKITLVFKGMLENSHKHAREYLKPLNWVGEVNILYSMIVQYFEHLEERLRIKGLNHITLIDVNVYPHHDFLSYRPEKFLDFLDLWNLQNLKQYNYRQLAEQYAQVVSADIVSFRSFLIDSKEKLNGVSNLKSKKVDLKMVTYSRIDRRNIEDRCKQMATTQEKLDCFLEAYGLRSTQNLDGFIKIVSEVLEESDLARYGPAVHPFGSLSNGLATYDSDIDIFVQFTKLNVKDGLDYETGLLALKLIDELFCKLINKKGRKQHVIFSRRCPIIKLEFKKTFAFLASDLTSKARDELSWNKCDISVTQMHGVFNSRILHFLTTLDASFKHMAMLLKYWAKNNYVISSDALSTYAFTMLVIYFLQTRKPYVLPTFEFLKRIASPNTQENKRVGLWDFECCTDIDLVGCSRNQETLERLIVEFFKFYAQFDFYHFAIRPRYGQKFLKSEMAQEKANTSFNVLSYICIEDPYVLDHNVGYNFRTKNISRLVCLMNVMASKITEQNCIDMLVRCEAESLPSAGRTLFPPLRMSDSMLVCAKSLLLEKDPILSKKPFGPVQSVRRFSIIAEQMSNFMLEVLGQFFKSYLRFQNDKQFELKNNPSDVIECNVSLEWLNWFNMTVLPNMTPIKHYSNRRKDSNDCLIEWLNRLRHNIRQNNKFPRAGTANFLLFRLEMTSDMETDLHKHLWYRYSYNHGFHDVADMIHEILYYFLHVIDRGMESLFFQELLSANF